MKEALNLQSPYKVLLDKESLIYTFTTKYFIQYAFIFYEALEYFESVSTYENISKVYGCTLMKVSETRERLDFDTEKTINKIVEHFFSDKANSLIYLCDTSDSKQLKRKYKFDTWYYRNENKSNYEKLDVEILVSDSVNYSSIIYHKENPFKSDLKIAFHEFTDELKDK
ncbi:MAG: DUF6169 family protein [Psychroflexus sp.]